MGVLEATFVLVIHSLYSVLIEKNLSRSKIKISILFILEINYYIFFSVMKYIENAKKFYSYHMIKWIYRFSS